MTNIGTIFQLIPDDHKFEFNLDEHIRSEMMQAAHEGDILKLTLLVHQHGTERLSNLKKFGTTALTWTVWHSPRYMTEILLDIGIDPNIPDNNGKYPLHLLMRDCNTGVTQDYSMMKKFVDSGADINCRDIDGETPLMMMATSGNVETVKYLIQLGADINLKSHAEISAVIMAQIRGHSDVVETLRDTGATDDVPRSQMIALKQQHKITKIRRFFRILIREWHYLLFGK